MEEARPIVQRVALLACSITSVSVRALKRALFGSLRSGRHSTGDRYIRQKYGSIYATLWTCPECNVFTALFKHITTRSILQEDRGQTHTFLLNTNFGSRTPQLPAVTTCYRRGRKPCVCCSGPFSLSRLVANLHAPGRRHARRCHCAFVRRET